MPPPLTLVILSRGNSLHFNHVLRSGEIYLITGNGELQECSSAEVYPLTECACVITLNLCTWCIPSYFYYKDFVSVNHGTADVGRGWSDHGAVIHMDFIHKIFALEICSCVQVV